MTIFFEKMFSHRVDIGAMTCTVIGICFLILSFFLLRMAVGKYLPNDKEEKMVSKSDTKAGMVAIIGFLLIFYFLVHLPSTGTFTAIASSISHLFISSGIAIYFIRSRPSLCTELINFPGPKM